MLRAKTPPSVMSSWVTAAFSTLIPTSFGSKLTCVAQLSVMRFRLSPARLPITYSPEGNVHSTRRRSRSYSSCCSSVSMPGG